MANPSTFFAVVFRQLFEAAFKPSLHLSALTLVSRDEKRLNKRVPSV